MGAYSLLKKGKKAGKKGGKKEKNHFNPRFLPFTKLEGEGL